MLVHYVIFCPQCVPYRMYRTWMVFSRVLFTMTMELNLVAAWATGDDGCVYIISRLLVRPLNPWEFFHPNAQTSTHIPLTLHNHETFNNSPTKATKSTVMKSQPGACNTCQLRWRFVREFNSYQSLAGAGPGIRRYLHYYFPVPTVCKSRSINYIQYNNKRTC